MISRTIVSGMLIWTQFLRDAHLKIETPQIWPKFSTQLNGGPKNSPTCVSYNRQTSTLIARENQKPPQTNFQKTKPASFSAVVQ